MNDDVFLIITMAVPSLFQKMFGIINQMHTRSKVGPPNVNNLLDGTKKCFASILHHYQSNSVRDEPHGERKPIDTLIRLTKTVFWADILKVSRTFLFLFRINVS